MSFSYNAVWEDTVRLLRQNAPLLAAIAGVFLFLPNLLFTVMLPPPVPPPGVDPQRALQITLDFWQAAWPWFLVTILFTMVGTLAMLRLVFAGDTVGGALVHGLILTPFYFLLSLICGLMIGFGFLLIVPGLYLFGRLAPFPAVLVAENRRNPFDAIGRTFALTKGHGWAILGIIVVIMIVAFIAMGVADTLFGLVFVLAAGQELGKTLTAVVSSALGAAFAVLVAMLYAAIYRALAVTSSVAATFE